MKLYPNRTIAEALHNADFQEQYATREDPHLIEDFVLLASEIRKAVSELKEISTDAGDNLDRTGEYMSDKIQKVIKRLTNTDKVV